MNRVKNIFGDLFKTFRIGSYISIAIIILVSTFSVIANGNDFKKILLYARSALFIIGSLGLLVSSMFILKTNSRRNLKNQDEWKEKFKEFSFVSVIFIASIIILVYGTLIDSVLFT